GLRRAFLATALFYAIGLVVVHFMYDEGATACVESANGDDANGATRGTFRKVLAFQNFILMMGVIFGVQFVDRSLGPVLPLYVEQAGIGHGRVAFVSGVLFSI